MLRKQNSFSELGMTYDNGPVNDCLSFCILLLFGPLAPTRA